MVHKLGLTRKDLTPVTLKLQAANMTEMNILPQENRHTGTTQHSALPSNSSYNRGKLEQRIRDFYASSEFNVCEHQKLPIMSGEPRSLMVDPTVQPKAVHNPVPIPVLRTCQYISLCGQNGVTFNPKKFQF